MNVRCGSAGAGTSEAEGHAGVDGHRREGLPLKGGVVAAERLLHADLAASQSGQGAFDVTLHHLTEAVGADADHQSAVLDSASSDVELRNGAVQPIRKLRHVGGFEGEGEWWLDADLLLISGCRRD